MLECMASGKALRTVRRGELEGAAGWKNLVNHVKINKISKFYNFYTDIRGHGLP